MAAWLNSKIEVGQLLMKSFYMPTLCRLNPEFDYFKPAVQQGLFYY